MFAAVCRFLLDRVPFSPSSLERLHTVRSAIQQNERSPPHRSIELSTHFDRLTFFHFVTRETFANLKLPAAFRWSNDRSELLL